jgi:hypothetical protein
LGDEDGEKLLKFDDISAFYDLMKGPYEAACEEMMLFWIWIMTNLVTIVSKEWNDRVTKGIKIMVRDSASGMPEEEQLSHYVSSSDLAYIPVVVSIFDRRELQGGKRRRG